MNKSSIGDDQNQNYNADEDDDEYEDEEDDNASSNEIIQNNKSLKNANYENSSDPMRTNEINNNFKSASRTIAKANSSSDDQVDLKISLPDKTLVCLKIKQTLNADEVYKVN